MDKNVILSTGAMLICQILRHANVIFSVSESHVMDENVVILSTGGMLTHLTLRHENANFSIHIHPTAVTDEISRSIRNDV